MYTSYINPFTAPPSSAFIYQRLGTPELTYRIAEYIAPVEGVRVNFPFHRHWREYVDMETVFHLMRTHLVSTYVPRHVRMFYFQRDVPVKMEQKKNTLAVMHSGTFADFVNPSNSEQVHGLL